MSTQLVDMNAIRALSGTGPNEQDFQRLQSSAQQESKVATEVAGKIEARAEKFENVSQSALEAMTTLAKEKNREETRDAVAYDDYTGAVLKLEGRMRELGAAQSEAVSNFLKNREIANEAPVEFLAGPLRAIQQAERKRIAQERMRLGAQRIAEMDMMQQNLSGIANNYRAQLEAAKPQALRDAVQEASVQQIALEGAKTSLEATTQAGSARRQAASAATQAAGTVVQTKLQIMQQRLQELMVPLEAQQKLLQMEQLTINIEEAKDEQKKRKAMDEWYSVMAKEQGITETQLRAAIPNAETLARVSRAFSGNPTPPTNVDEVRDVVFAANAVKKNFEFFPEIAPALEGVANAQRDASGKIPATTFALRTPEGEPTELGKMIEPYVAERVNNAHQQDFAKRYVNSAQGIQAATQTPRMYKYYLDQAKQSKQLDVLEAARMGATGEEIFAFFDNLNGYVNDNIGLSLLGSPDRVGTQIKAYGPTGGIFGGTGINILTSPEDVNRFIERSRRKAVEAQVQQVRQANELPQNRTTSGGAPY